MGHPGKTEWAFNFYCLGRAAMPAGVVTAQSRAAIPTGRIPGHASTTKPDKINSSIHILYEIHLLFLTLINVFLYCFLTVRPVPFRGDRRTVTAGSPRNHVFRKSPGTNESGISQLPSNGIVSFCFLNQRHKEAT
jgi:hypothetical protein